MTGITSITRDWPAAGPAIVRITTTDSHATITAPGYIAAQRAQIDLVNSGDFEWEASDYVLAYYHGDSWGFFTYDAATQSLTDTASAELTTTVALTFAQIRALYDTPVLLLAAQGAGSLIVIDNILWDITYGSAQYANGGAIAAQYGNTVHGAGPAASATIAAATLNGVAASSFLSALGTGISVTKTASLNTAVYLSAATADFITGDSTAVLYIRYRVLRPA